MIQNYEDLFVDMVQSEDKKAFSPLRDPQKKFRHSVLDGFDERMDFVHRRASLRG